MKIYTRTGDGGETGLFGGGRVPKGHRRVEAYGTVDELNAVLGLCVELVSQQDIREKLLRLQHDLFAVGASLATPNAGGGRSRPALPPLPRGRVEEMERWMDQADEELPTLRSFVLPGGSPGAAVLHLARTVCRRAERAVVRLAGEEVVEDGVVPYLNRLSDLLFVLARLENHRSGKSDVVWGKEPDGSP